MFFCRLLTYIFIMSKQKPSPVSNMLKQIGILDALTKIFAIGNVNNRLSKACHPFCDLRGEIFVNKEFEVITHAAV